MNVYGKRCLMSGCRGQLTQEYNDKMLYNQLLYYDMLFDIEKAKKKASNEDKGIFNAKTGTNHKTLFLRLQNKIARDLMLREGWWINTSTNAEGGMLTYPQYSALWHYKR